jgi:hypothetical protein
MSNTDKTMKSNTERIYIEKEEKNAFSYDKENKSQNSQLVYSKKESDSQIQNKSQITRTIIKQDKYQDVCALCSGNILDEHPGDKHGTGLSELWLHDACFELTKVIEYQEDLIIEVLSHFTQTNIHGCEKLEYKELPRTSEGLLVLLETENIECTLKATSLIQPFILQPLVSEILDVIFSFIKIPENIGTFENNAQFYIAMIDLHDLKFVCKGFYHAFNRQFPRDILKSIFSDRGLDVLEFSFFPMMTPLDSLVLLQAILHPKSPFGKIFRRIFQLNDACYLFAVQLYNEEYNEDQMEDMIVYGNKAYLLSDENKFYLQHSGKKKIHVFEDRFEYSEVGEDDKSSNDGNSNDEGDSGEGGRFNENKAEESNDSRYQLNVLDATNNEMSNTNNEETFQSCESPNTLQIPLRISEDETPSKKRKLARELFPSDCK